MDKTKFFQLLKRILALLGAIGLLLLAVFTLVFAITGNPNFMGMLLITLMAPILLWVYMFIYKLVKGKSIDEMAKDEPEKK